MHGAYNVKQCNIL
jgi:hypothetical protein